jgi:uncharacterized membrane protein
MPGRQTFERFRVAFWVFSAGVVGLYLYGLVWQAYSPLQLGALSVVCLALLALFVVHEVMLRRDLRNHPREVDHADKERRGF